MFPAQSYHHLVKDYKLDPENYNNPFNDAKKAKNLFYDEVNAFAALDEELKRIYGLLDPIERAKSIERVADSDRYGQPDKLYLHVSRKDVWLDYLINKQWNMRNLVSGAYPTKNRCGCFVVRMGGS